MQVFRYFGTLLFSSMPMDASWAWREPFVFFKEALDVRNKKELIPTLIGKSCFWMLGHKALLRSLTTAQRMLVSVFAYVYGEEKTEKIMRTFEAIYAEQKNKLVSAKDRATLLLCRQ